MLTAVLVALSLAGAGQAAPPAIPRADVGQPRDPGRRPPPEPVGTAAIRGRVIVADTGNPARRATVSISMVPPPQPTTAAPPGGTPVNATRMVSTVNGVATVTFTGGFRSKTVTADAQGAFEFIGLPQGSYRLVASPAQYSAGYLPIAFGAKRPASPGTPSDPGTPIDLSDGQVFDKATVALPRGAVITGRVTDENGDPLARVQVYTLLFSGGGPRGFRSGNTVSTDDLGQFRLFGMPPGDYVVAAEARGNNYVPPNAPPETEEERFGFITTYYPNAVDDSSAQRVRTKAGAETPGVEIRMVSGRLFHLTGMVTDSQGRPGVRANGSLQKRSPSTGVSTSFGFSTDETGHFQMRNLPPGNYRLSVRQQLPPGARVDGSQGEQAEFATVPISIAADVEDVLIATSPGATITGSVTFDGGPPQLPANQASQLRVFAQVSDPDTNFGGPSPSATLTPDFTFTMKGLAGEMLLRLGVPNNSVKAIMLGAEDIADTPHEFKTGERVTIVMTSRASTLEGSVTDAAGKPTSDAVIVLFSDDKTFWRGSSIRTKRSGADATGHYRVIGLLPGRYILVALPRDRASMLGQMNDAAAFEALAKEGTTVVIGEDEQRQVDVRVSNGGGGY